MFSVLKPSRVSPTFPAMRLKLLTCAVLACAAVPPAAPRAKLAGKVVDAAAFSKVKTYCVDTSNLKGPVYPGDVPRPEEFDVLELVKRESGPKGLLSKLPWRLEADCAAPAVDAIVRLRFRALIGPAGERVFESRAAATYPREAEFRWGAELQVTDKASRRVVYKSDGNPVDSPLVPTGDQVEVQLYHVLRQDAARLAVAALVSDVETISKRP